MDISTPRTSDVNLRGLDIWQQCKVKRTFAGFVISRSRAHLCIPLQIPVRRLRNAREDLAASSVECQVQQASRYGEDQSLEAVVADWNSGTITVKHPPPKYPHVTSTWNSHLAAAELDSGHSWGEAGYQLSVPAGHSSCGQLSHHVATSLDVFWQTCETVIILLI
jgi:hypothetical protein